ncbi:MAG: orotidine-5'-phosphate decarboxylase [Desulfurococcales archaeon]|nr:orotidine-5'-phosphate decarboxylase [Desulfurococcales archaeon]
MAPRLIVALDSLRGDTLKIRELVGKLCGVAAGFKIGWPNIVWGGRGVVEAAHDTCPEALQIADLKLADISYVMRETLTPIIKWVDAVIAHAFIGTEGALRDLKRWLEGEAKRLILVASMSHEGSREVIDPCIDRILDVVRRVKPWGVVAPATRPDMVRVIRERLGRGVVILAPGVGAQGARPGDALRAGADYEIVGRMIALSRDPVAEAEKVAMMQEEALRGSPR